MEFAGQLSILGGELTPYAVTMRSGISGELCTLSTLALSAGHARRKAEATADAGGVVVRVTNTLTKPHQHSNETEN